MDDLQVITGLLMKFAPRIIRNTGRMIYGIRCGMPGSEADCHPDTASIVLCDGDADARATDAGEGLCLFVIGGSEDQLYDERNSIVFFPADTDRAALENSTVEACRELIRIKSANERIFTAFARREGIDSILTAAELELRNPMVVFDRSAKLLGSGAKFQKGGFPGAYWESLRTRGYFLWKTSADVQRFLASTRDLASLLVNNRDPFFLTLDEFPTQARRLMYKIVAHREIIGHCAAMEFDEPFREGDIEIMRSTALLVGLELERTSVKSINAGADSVIFKELYNREFSSLQELKLRTAPLGWKIEGNFYLLSIAPERITTEKSYVTAVLLTNTLSRHFPEGCVDVKVYSDESRFMFLLNVDDVANYQGIRRFLCDYLESEELQGAISARFTDIMDLRRMADTNDHILETGKIMDCKQSLFDGEDLYFPLIASELIRSPRNFDEFTLEISRLRQYDEEYGTDFLETVYTYLDTGRSVAKTAQRLFLHRNTVMRRLERFAEITGYDLNEGEWAYKTYVAFQLEEYRRRVNKKSSEN